ncbi:MAG: hypothetical protein JO257_07095 [Deltaproteobacteria bacterium]|nr:hypothetical protein [Deltaproteobacteria bacterium]
MAGCWSDDPLVDGELTAAQLAHFREQFHHTAFDPCALPPGVDCNKAAQLGQELFFDVRLSDSGTGSGSDYRPSAGTGKTSCATCHDPNGYFIDTRMPNSVSQGQTKWTRRNAMTLLDLQLKASLTNRFTWDGSYHTAGDVLTLAITKAMSAKTANVAYYLQHEPQYATLFWDAFGMADPYEGAKLAFDAYLYRLAGESPFDAYVDGDDTALSADAKRGFGVFVGRGTCVECHSGPALGDFVPRNTGVAQAGSASDAGAGSADGDPADLGAFVTPSLRNIAMTGPYMHAGQLASLSAVIDFYRRGGDATSFPGTKDPRMVALELTDDDARDLEAFLVSLTDAPVDASLRQKLCPAGSGSQCP